MPVLKRDLEIARLKQELEDSRREIEIMTIQRQIDAREVARLRDEVINLKNMLDAQIRQNQILLDCPAGVSSGSRLTVNPAFHEDG